MSASTAPTYLAESTAQLEKKSASDGLDTLSVSSIEAEGYLPGDSHIRGSGMFGTVSNLVNTIIGSGVLALPACAAKVGWLLAIILMVASAAITWVGLHFLTACAHKLGGDKTSFGATAARTYPWMAIVVDFGVYLSPWLHPCIDNEFLLCFVGPVSAED